MAKIKVTISGQEVELTVQEARGLFEQLDEVFGEERQVTIPSYVVPYVPEYDPRAPYGPGYPPYYYREPYITWTGGNTDGTVTITG